MGKEVGCKNSASRMNSAVVIFLYDVSKVERVVESFIVLRDAYERILSPITIVLMGCKSPNLKHCLQRQFFMILKDSNSHVNLTLNFY